jgi:cyclophilin family peptidyl-prolyl cis-trans isomerase
MVDDPVVLVRRACAEALSQANLSGLTGGVLVAIRADIRSALRDPDGEVRVNAVRAAARMPSAERSEMEACAFDADWRVRVAAIEVLGRRISGSATRFGAFMGRVIDSVGKPPAEPTGLHIHRALIDVARPYAEFEAVRTQALRVMRALSRAEPDGDAGQLHCDYAALADIGRGWPTDVRTCGFGFVSQDKLAELSLQVVSAARGSDADRSGYVQRAFRSDSSTIRQAAVEAAGSLPVDNAVPLVLESLSDTDLGVCMAGLSVLASRGRLWSSSAADLSSRIRQRMDQVRLRFETAGDAQGLVAWLDATHALGRADYRDDWMRLARGRHRAVRDRIAAVDASMMPPALPSQPDESGTELLAGGQLLRFADMETSRGLIRLEFDVAGAPRTVRRFQKLVAEGFYAGLSFHRVVPGFLAQAGDPRGDGYGGPGAVIPCEDGPTRYRRGSVGMALSGRDTGGSQFFITYSDQPHLDGDYTRFAQIVSGMEALESLQPGDLIIRIGLSEN